MDSREKQPSAAHQGLSDWDSPPMEPPTEVSGRRSWWPSAWNFDRTLRLVEVVVISATLVFLLVQNAMMQRQNEINFQDARFTTATAVKDHLNKINLLLLDNQHEDIRRQWDLSKSEIIAFILISEYEWLYVLHKQGIIDDTRWDNLESLMKMTMNSDFMKTTWKSARNMGRDQEYKIFVEHCIYENEGHMTDTDPRDIQIIGSTGGDWATFCHPSDQSHAWYEDLMEELSLSSSRASPPAAAARP